MAANKIIEKFVKEAKKDLETPIYKVARKCAPYIMKY